MREANLSLISGQLVEEDTWLSLQELCQASSAEPAQVITWVFEGVLEPLGQEPDDWRFAGTSLRRARLALRLARDLELNAAGVALALDLLDEIAVLKAQLRRAGVRSA